MSGKEKTPGQAAYEHRIAAESRRFPARVYLTWRSLSPAERADEEAAAAAAAAPAHERTAELLAQLNEVRAERDGLHDQLAAACAGLERIAQGTADTADASSIAEKALYAAIGHADIPKPKPVTAGTQYLLDVGSPDAWQPVPSMPAEGR